MKKKNQSVIYILSIGVLSVLLLLTVIPFLMLLFLSTKDNLDILINFWGIPKQIKWVNYVNAFDTVKNSIGKSLFLCGATIVLSVLFGSLSGYVFARHKFPLKEKLYILLIGCMMIPSMLMIVPLYSIINSMHLINNYWGLILPYASGLQLFGLIILRAFFEALPEELFEAARLDGGSEFYLYRAIALPLSIPIIITIAIFVFLGVYNDYMLPLIILKGQQSTFTVAVVNLTSAGRKDMGLTLGAYVIGSIPIIILLSFGMKYYIVGLTQASVKG